MAHFVRRAVARYASPNRYTRVGTVRRLVHTQDSPPVQAKVIGELKRVEDGCVRRHRELADDLAKLHKKVMEGYSDARLQKGDSRSRIGTIIWRVCSSLLFFLIASNLVTIHYYMLSALVKEKRTELEAKLQRMVREKVRAVRAQAFEAGRRSALSSKSRSTPWAWPPPSRREDKLGGRS